MNAIEIQSLVTQYSSLTRLMISLGLDAFHGIKALIATFHKELTIDEQNAILEAVKANSEVREAMANAAAGIDNVGTLTGNVTTD